MGKIRSLAWKVDRLAYLGRFFKIGYKRSLVFVLKTVDRSKIKNKKKNTYNQLLKFTLIRFRERMSSTPSKYTNDFVKSPQQQNNEIAGTLLLYCDIKQSLNASNIELTLN